VPRDLKAHEQHKKSAARREFALARRDLREPTVPRATAVGAFSHAVKVMDPGAAEAIQAFLKGKAGTKP
jgi:hypothetical protein